MFLVVRVATVLDENRTKDLLNVQSYASLICVGNVTRQDISSHRNSPLFHLVFLSEVLPLSFPSCGRLHTFFSCSLYSFPPCGRPIALCAHLSLPILRTCPPYFTFALRYVRNHLSNENGTQKAPFPTVKIIHAVTVSRPRAVK
jgi:hypothetical protein